MLTKVNSYKWRRDMGGGCSIITGADFNNNGRQVNCHGTIITLPEKFTWILERHGDKTNKSPTRGGELTPLGRKQVWDTSWQLIEKFGQEAMDVAHIAHSPVYRVCQSKNIFMSALGRNPNEAIKFEMLEWGPNDGHDKDLFTIELLIDASGNKNEPTVLLGHNGLWNKVAEIIHPNPDGYDIQPGEAFIITESGIEIISPRVTA